MAMPRAHDRSGGAGRLAVCTSAALALDAVEAAALDARYVELCCPALLEARALQVGQCLHPHRTVHLHHLHIVRKHCIVMQISGWCHAGSANMKQIFHAVCTTLLFLNLMALVRAHVCRAYVKSIPALASMALTMLTTQATDMVGAVLDARRPRRPVLAQASSRPPARGRCAKSRRRLPGRRTRGRRRGCACPEPVAAALRRGDGDAGQATLRAAFIAQYSGDGDPVRSAAVT